jgi:hypothetical protein
LVKATKADAQLLLKFFEVFYGNEHVMKAILWLWEMPAFKSYEEFKRKYPSGSEAQVNIIVPGIYYEMLGVLVRHKLINENLLFDMYRTAASIGWDKLELVIEGMREELKWPELFENYEWLAERQSVWRNKHPRKLPGSK